MRSRRDSGYDLRRTRTSLNKTQDTANSIWQGLTEDPIVRLAELRWFKSEGERENAKIQDELIELRRALKRGDLSQRDHDADEQSAQLRLQN